VTKYVTVSYFFNNKNRTISADLVATEYRQGLKMIKQNWPSNQIQAKELRSFACWGRPLVGVGGLCTLSSCKKPKF
jgi:hypothetical protein